MHTTVSFSIISRSRNQDVNVSAGGFSPVKSKPLVCLAKKLIPSITAHYVNEELGVDFQGLFDISCRCITKSERNLTNLLDDLKNSSGFLPWHAIVDIWRGAFKNVNAWWKRNHHHSIASPSPGRDSILRHLSLVLNLQVFCSQLPTIALPWIDLNNHHTRCAWNRRVEPYQHRICLEKHEWQPHLPSFRIWSDEGHQFGVFLQSVVSTNWGQRLSGERIANFLSCPLSYSSDLLRLCKAFNSLRVTAQYSDAWERRVNISTLVKCQILTFVVRKGTPMVFASHLCLMNLHQFRKLQLT